MTTAVVQEIVQGLHKKAYRVETRLPDVGEGGKFAWPLSALSLVFSAIALPVTYVVVPFCRPAVVLADRVATLGVVSGAYGLALAGLMSSLLAVYAVADRRSKTSLAFSGVSMAIATAFIVFGLALRTCAT